MEATEVCSVCKHEKPLTDFNKKSRNKDGLQLHCRICNSEILKNWYAKNRKHQLDKNMNRKRLLRKQYNNYKQQLQCSCCPEKEPCCLEFHHKDGKQKDFNLAIAAAYGYSWDRILEEIEKCIVVCSNCHKKIHKGKITLPDGVIAA